jgi:hypothetical protein
VSKNQQKTTVEHAEVAAQDNRVVPLARLVCTDPVVDSDLEGLEITLVDQEQRIGRAQDNSVVIDYMRVSRYHARVYTEDGGWAIEDLTSTNGLYVNDKRVEKTALNHGDHLLIASIPFRYELSYNQQQVVDEKSSALLEEIEPSVVKKKLNQNPEATIVMSGSSYASAQESLAVDSTNKRSRLGLIVALGIMLILLSFILVAVLA